MPVPENEVVISQNIPIGTASTESKLGIDGWKLETGNLLSKAKIDLSERWPEESINEGFRYNILLSLWYLKMSQKEPNFEPKIAFTPGAETTPEVFKDSTSGVIGNLEEVGLDLETGEVFAFHRNVLPEYGRATSLQLPVTSEKEPDANYLPADATALQAGQLPATNYQTMGSEFLVEQGYRSVMGLGGNGVCHLASLINWAASEAGLQVLAPTDHAFAEIPGVPRKYWTSIKYQENSTNSQLQNLYVTNNKDFTVRFLFEKNREILEIKILKT